MLAKTLCRSRVFLQLLGARGISKDTRPRDILFAHAQPRNASCGCYAAVKRGEGIEEDIPPDGEVTARRETVFIVTTSEARHDAIDSDSVTGLPPAAATDVKWLFKNISLRRMFNFRWRLPFGEDGHLRASVCVYISSPSLPKVKKN